MCKLRTNFQLNHAICLTSRPKPRCCFFSQDIERHPANNETVRTYMLGIKSGARKARQIDHDFVSSDSAPFTEHLMFRVYFWTKGNTASSSSTTEQ
jgi:hypothetical protein